MSWSIEEHIGECRPWPAQVVVYRGETDECLAYVSGEVADQLKAENAKLCADVERLRQELAIHEASEQEKYIDYLRHEDVDWEDKYRSVVAENAKLRDEYTKLAQHTIEVESDLCDYIGQYDPTDAFVVAVGKENVKLRELVMAFDWCTENFDMPDKCDRCPLPQSSNLEPECELWMRELGVEVDA